MKDFTRKDLRTQEAEWRSGMGSGYVPSRTSSKTINGLAFIGWTILIIVGLVIIDQMWRH